MAVIDPVTNFAIVSVSTGYTAASTSIVLASGEGAKLPAPATDGAFNLVWWNSTDFNNPADDPNREIVRVTARSTDTLTVTRGQESITATTKNTAGKTYKMARVITKKDWGDMSTTKVKIGTISYDVSTASGTTVVTGVGFQPTEIEFIGVIPATKTFSTGFSDGSNHRCILTDDGVATDTWNAGPTSCIALKISAGNIAVGTVAMNSDGFTISWTKTGAPTGTATIYYRARK